MQDGGRQSCWAGLQGGKDSFVAKISRPNERLQLGRRGNVLKLSEVNLTARSGCSIVRTHRTSCYLGYQGLLRSRQIAASA